MKVASSILYPEYCILYLVSRSEKNMQRIPYKDLHQTLKQILIKYNFSDKRADLSARLFTETNLDGFASHGINRFPAYIRGIQRGYIKPDALAKCRKKNGTVENWDGSLGPGNLNAYACMQRAIEIAKTQGLGCVALRNTNHWLRGGSYGWQAADANCIGICWTNTKPNLPPWGATEAKLGNNPFVMAVPRSEGHIVLDMALSLFSYGKLESFRRNNESLPMDGGYDHNGNLSRDPGEIEQTERLLPIGFWKGSGLSMMLDIIAAILSEGDAVHQIGKRDHEYGLSQIFIAIDASKPGVIDSDAIIDNILEYNRSSDKIHQGANIYYPGEQTLIRRKENLKNGIPVDYDYWQEILEMV